MSMWPLCLLDLPLCSRKAENPGEVRRILGNATKPLRFTQI